jgi:ubiquinone/menaquinone biosynthesis C-methylase UbiE
MTTTLAQRHEAEQRFHDDQAAGRAETFLHDPARWHFHDDEFLDHESWVRSAFAHFGELRGKTALDYGCGHGMAAVVLARAGAAVRAFDLSPRYVEEAQQRASANGVSVEFTTADAEHLPYEACSFDAIWGNAILHHLDLHLAGAELHRVLKPGGVAVFCEPWGGNPVLEFARRHLPYPGKHRTADEAPLRAEHLTSLRQNFPDLQFQPQQLLGMVRRVLPWRWLQRPLVKLDAALFRTVTPLCQWCRYAVIVLRKPHA